MTETTWKGSVYLSGPITGQTYDDARFGWRQMFAEGMKPGIKVLSPMRHEGHLAEIKGGLEQHYPEHYFSGARVIVEKDRLDIKRSDIVLVNLLGATQRVSIGTVAEIGMAFEAGKTIILVMEDAGTAVVGQHKEGVKDDWDTVPTYGNNIHDHPFVTQPAALRLNNLTDAIYAINALLSEGI